MGAGTRQSLSAKCQHEETGLGENNEKSVKTSEQGTLAILVPPKEWAQRTMAVGVEKRANPNEALMEEMRGLVKLNMRGLR